MTAYERLTDKEKATLRLLLRGHDAKSSARALGLSVHTVNERLRDARRKLGVTSSREAARIVHAAEGAAPELLGDKSIGDAAAADTGASGAAATGRWAKRRFAVIGTGVFAMSLILAALLLPASPVALLPNSAGGGTGALAQAAEATPARAAEQFLILLDEGRWAESYAATGAQFRTLNSLERWTEVSRRVRTPLGETVTRNIVGDEFVPAPPEGYRLIKFRSTYANGTAQTENLSLAWEDSAWKVVGIMFD
ncbi:DUF4019 domain-containing protein [Altererythrobacter sp. H2]|uniref:helix-turn-helix domain-containing protein n=1 Tax=Altererythrobacter sp. H2 TaxID=3108391 RepID=UPI002B4BA447|nr:DUF4019 domain-containing protein [Altererythrobacter sp. H2]WRK95864.1 DUF4019 domain-containing protein [Altererythrobacter sp. H2]